MSALEDLGTFLATKGVGVVGTSLFYNSMPAAPPICVVLSEYGGVMPESALGVKGVHLEYPRVQFICRHTGMAAGRALAETAYRALAEIANQTVNGRHYLRVTPQQQPFFLMHDENERPMHVFNVECERLC